MRWTVTFGSFESANACFMLSDYVPFLAEKINKRKKETTKIKILKGVDVLCTLDGISLYSLITLHLWKLALLYSTWPLRLFIILTWDLLLTSIMLYFSQTESHLTWHQKSFIRYVFFSLPFVFPLLVHLPCPTRDSFFYQITIHLTMVTSYSFFSIACFEFMK